MMILQILKAHVLDFDSVKVKHMLKHMSQDASGKGLLPPSNLASGLEY